MFALSSTLPIFTVSVATSILIAGVVDDLRSRKFHNWLFLTCAFIAFSASLFEHGFSGAVPAVLGFLAGAFLLLPMVLLGIIGAGDMKLMAAFGAVAHWEAVAGVAILGLFWGALFGLTRAIVSKQAPVLAKNMLLLIVNRRSDGLELNRIPYTVALLFGWLSYLTMGGL